MSAQSASSHMGKVAPAFGAAFLLCAVPAHSQSGGVGDISGQTAGSAEALQNKVADFARQNAANRQSCEIVVQSTGTLAPNVGATKLSSLGYSGEPARADVTTTNGSFYVSVDQPLGFVQAPQGGNNDVVFTTWMSGRGKTSFADTPGQNRVKLKNGLTNMEIGLEVAKQNGAFPTGRYQAELTLRCE